MLIGEYLKFFKILTCKFSQSVCRFASHGHVYNLRISFRQCKTFLTLYKREREREREKQRVVEKIWREVIAPWNNYGTIWRHGFYEKEEKQELNYISSNYFDIFALLHSIIRIRQRERERGIPSNSKIRADYRVSAVQLWILSFDFQSTLC